MARNADDGSRARAAPGFPAHGAPQGRRSTGAGVPRRAPANPEPPQRGLGRLVLGPDTRPHVARGVGEQRGGVAARVRPHGAGPRAVRGAHARGRAPAALPQPQGQRLGRPLAARLPVVHADRPLPARSHGAPPGGVRPRRARHPAVSRLPDLTRLPPPQARTGRDRPDRVEALQGAAARRARPRARWDAGRGASSRCSSC